MDNLMRQLMKARRESSVSDTLVLSSDKANRVFNDNRGVFLDKK